MTVLPEKSRDKAWIPEEILRPARECMYGRSPWPLVLLGPAGVGKTCAALCMADYTLGPRRYLTADELTDRVFRSSRGELWRDEGLGRVTRITTPMFWADWKGAEFAILDELGLKSEPHDYDYTFAKSAIDYREERPLVVISNIDLEGVAYRYSDRLASRLAGGTVVQYDGEDRRLGG